MSNRKGKVGRRVEKGVRSLTNPRNKGRQDVQVSSVSLLRSFVSCDLYYVASPRRRSRGRRDLASDNDRISCERYQEVQN